MRRELMAIGMAIAMACAFMAMTGCATILSGTSAPISINSSPGSANVEIKSTDGLVIETGMTPMTTKLKKGREYFVTISLDGYQTESVSVVKGDIEKTAYCNVTDLAGWGIDYLTGAMFKLEPRAIHVNLREVTAHDGSGSAVYAILTIVDEGGTPQHAAVELTPVAAN